MLVEPCGANDFVERGFRRGHAFGHLEPETMVIVGPEVGRGRPRCASLQSSPPPSTTSRKGRPPPPLSWSKFFRSPLRPDAQVAPGPATEKHPGWAAPGLVRTAVACNIARVAICDGEEVGITSPQLGTRWPRTLATARASRFARALSPCGSQPRRHRRPRSVEGGRHETYQSAKHHPDRRVR